MYYFLIDDVIPWGEFADNSTPWYCGEFADIVLFTGLIVITSLKRIKDELEVDICRYG